MEEFKVILLGLVQGMTEFLPISSSAHIVIFGKYLGFAGPIFSLTLFLHLGTVAATVVFFNKEIKEIIIGLFRGGPGKRLILLIIVGSIPGLIIGLTLGGAIARVFPKIGLVATMLILNGLILFFAERLSPAEGREGIEIKEAFLIGLAQGIALLPGISRSGITIATGMVKGISREVVASYSFLLSIPAVLGAAAIELFGHRSFSLNADLFLSYLLGATVAFISGWVCLRLLFWFLKTRRLKVFAVYCLLVGIGVLTGKWLIG